MSAVTQISITEHTGRNVVSVEENSCTIIVEISEKGVGGGDVEEAPIDGNLYGRKNAAWEEISNEIDGGSSVSTYLQSQFLDGGNSIS